MTAERGVRLVLSGLASLVLGVLAWMFAPLVAGADDPVGRLVLGAVPLAVWAAAELGLVAVRRARDTRLASAASSLAGARRDEAAAVSERLAAALRSWKAAGQGALSERPWYAIIGPPGAGKTTALLNAGLRFPLAAEFGEGVVAGVGGTRLCDWWFTDEAVLIDTAGRYTTQDSEAEIDAAGWRAFLAALRRARPRQPLNGVLVAISLTDVAQGPHAERLAHAAAVRARLRELQSALGIRLPVYVVFTKADLLTGFTEFFDDLDRAARRQAWGVTFEPTDTDPPARFAAEFRQLVERLRARVLDRLQDERSIERRPAIGAFPGQVATLASPLAEFVRQACGDRGTFLRGVYLASGTQTGTPIDRLTGAMARDFGLDPERLPALRPEKGRSYFLGELLTGIVFNEAMLVRATPARARRRRLARTALFAAIGVATGCVLVALLAADLSARRRVDAAQAALGRYEVAAHGVTLDPIADADLAALVPLLDDARGLAAADGTGPAGAWSILSPQAILAAGGALVYRHALADALLPRMIWRLEAQMRGNLDRPDFLYEATRVYLMLGGIGPLDRSLVRDWMVLDWQAAYPGALQAPLRSDLATHLAALLAAPLPPVPLDGALIAAARAQFGRVPFAVRVYSRIAPSPAARALPAWRPSDALGPVGVGLFLRASGKPLDDGIPGFLTPDGFRRVLLTGLRPAARQVASESWVLGRQESVGLDAAELGGLEAAVVRLYVRDYEAAWDGLLADLSLVPLRSPVAAAQDLFILSAPQSPLRNLLDAIAPELTLASVSPAPRAGADMTAEQARLAALLGGAGGSTASTPPGYDVDVHFRDLRDFILRDDGAALDRALAPVRDLQQVFAKVAAAPAGSASWPVVGTDPIASVRAAAQDAPAPVSRWMLAIAGQAAALKNGDPRQQIVDAYNAGNGPAALCPLVVSGRFPFVAASTLDAPLDSFTTLVAPGGLLDGFVNTELAPYLDTSGATWAPRSSNGIAPPIDAAGAAAFQRAAAIRNAFFASGGPALRFSRTLTPIGVDAATRSATLVLGDTTITATSAPGPSTEVTWPGAAGSEAARLLFSPAPPGGTGVVATDGPWAFFRLLAQGTLGPTRPDGSTPLTFEVGGRTARFALSGGGANGPLPLPLLDGFACPSVR